MSIVLLVVTLSCFSPISSSTILTLSTGSSLFVENKDDVLISSNKIFSAGFYSTAVNAFFFAIWFTQPLYDGNHTIVWMANRNYPVIGNGSILSLLKNGNLVLTEWHVPIWETAINSTSSVQLKLQNNGNLVLATIENKVLWQSFDSPTDTLLPEQPLTRNTVLISSRSQTNYSSGFYKFRFDEYNILRLSFSNLEVSSLYWPYAWQHPKETNRTMYNSSRRAALDKYGYFISSDNLQFNTSDFGLGTQRRLVVDTDGNIRVYSLDMRRKAWEVSWQAIPWPCRIHGVCGANSRCAYSEFGRKCICLPGHKVKDETDWSYGCEPDFKNYVNISERDEFGFIRLPHSDFYGYDSALFKNYSLDMCKRECLSHFNCKGFLYTSRHSKGNNLCYIKSRLLNGMRALNFDNTLYVKLPIEVVNFYDQNEHLEGTSALNCSGQVTVQLARYYKKKNQDDLLQFMLWFSVAIGGVEIICLAYFLFLSMVSRKNRKYYQQVSTGFRRFTYEELKKATQNFSQEIGRGGSSIVYKGVLFDNRVAAIKRFKTANCQSEAEFLAEISIMGRLNHINLVEIWGYCVKGKQKFIVYEYLDHGSLAENLRFNALDWERRYEIAVGTAKGLAYLHEECLEWVLHCDIKPQNILLDSDYEPKVADFGLSKLLNRDVMGNSSFSKVRGTRGYMAPEWISNHRITSKVDVYSYGILALEMITGRSPKTGICPSSNDTAESDEKMLSVWVNEKKQVAAELGKDSWTDDIVDPRMRDMYDLPRLETLVQVALKCVADDENARPSMSEVVDMLLGNETDE